MLLSARDGWPARYAGRMKRAAASPIPAPEKPALADDERAARLQLLAQRLRDPDGLDRTTLSRIER
jgi:hypothetical protein